MKIMSMSHCQIEEMSMSHIGIIQKPLWHVTIKGLKKGCFAMLILRVKGHLSGLDWLTGPETLYHRDDALST